MIKFSKKTLSNGLRVIHHEDTSTPIVAVNLLYDVGARDEDPLRTGFAHLFEHLMFGGSLNIPSFDEPLQAVGGENNAFTNNDFTNYYVTLPATNIETAFWLESDRMLSLAFTPKSLEVQRNVVIEEFRQRYLNQPYGDAAIELRRLAYQKHPYRWATIGDDIAHIEQADMEAVKAFFSTFYHPGNAILSVAGNISEADTMQLAEKWFGTISAKEKKVRQIEPEPEQTEIRTKTLSRPVPQDALFMGWHMPGRLHKDFYTADVISDLLGNGRSSRLKENLIKKQQIFNSVDAYVWGSLDPGLFTVSGFLNPGISLEAARAAIEAEIADLMENELEETELDKVKNKLEATMVFSEINVLSKAMNLAYFELLGDAGMINEIISGYQKITTADIKRVGREIFREENQSVLYYKSEKP